MLERISPFGQPLWLLLPPVAGLFLCVLFAQRVGRERIQWHLAELFLLPVILTPALALWAQQDRPYHRAMAILAGCYALGGALLGWTFARARTTEHGGEVRSTGWVLGGFVLALALLAPTYRRWTIHTDEPLVVEALRAYRAAQAAYRERHGRYATGLAPLRDEGLAPAIVAADDGANGAAYHGYRFRPVFTDPLNGRPVKPGAWYVLAAIPEACGTSGARTFYADPFRLLAQDGGPDAAMGPRAWERPLRQIESFALESPPRR